MFDRILVDKVGEGKNTRILLTVQNLLDVVFAEREISRKIAILLIIYNKGKRIHPLITMKGRNGARIELL